MRRILLPVILLSSLALAAQTNKLHVTSQRTGMVLIAAATDGAALATDGAQFNADGTSSEVQKLFQVGKYGAILFSGNVSIQDPVDRPVREEVNAARIAKGWLDSHPDSTMKTAYSEINSLVLQTLTKFFSIRKSGTQAGKYLFSVIGVGVDGGKLLRTNENYFVPAAQGRAPRIERTSGTLKAGEIEGRGSEAILSQLVSGRSAAFKKFRAEPAMKKFLNATKGEGLSTQDFIDVFNIALAAVESEEGKMFSHGSSNVSPPNRFAIISPKDGFVWKK